MNFGKRIQVDLKVINRLGADFFRIDGEFSRLDGALLRLGGDIFLLGGGKKI